MIHDVTVLNFSPQINNYVSYPYVYALFKNYYELNGNKKYNWVNPKFLKQDVAPIEVAKWLSTLNLKFLFASLYVWNYSYTHLVLKEYRKLKQDTVIVVGGPHVFIEEAYFNQHPWIDLCCETTVYGEVFITDLLDGNEWKDVTGAVWRTGKSTKPFIIRDFIWATSPYANSLTYSLELSYLHEFISMQLETSRGCPFKCSFCEWGGGIGTKMNKRPLAEVKLDIDAMVAGGVDTLQICDSNFGFWEEDLEIIKYIAEYKKTVGYPRALEIYGWSKNNHKHHYNILKEIHSAGFSQHYAVSLQSIREETLINVRRSDVPAAQRVEFARQVSNEIGTPIQFELILGLPGDTLDDYYSAIDLRHEFKDFINFVWWLLPNTEAHTLEYRKKHGLITAWSETVEAEFEAKKPMVWEETKDSWEYVIGTNTLTPQEWLEGFLLDRFYVTAKHDPGAWDALEAARKKIGVTPKTFWKRIIASIPHVKQGGWNLMWAEAWPQFNQLIVPNSVNRNLYIVNIQGKDWKFPELPMEFYERGLEEIIEFASNATNIT
jgi:tRNA A37 methylthiotransferase MiaB